MPTVSEVSDNAKKLKEHIANQAGVPAAAVNDKNLKEVGIALDGAKIADSKGADPTKLPIVQLKQAAGEENKSSEKDLSNQQKIAMTIAALAPTLIGYAVGGNRGGGIGSKVGSDAIGLLQNQENLMENRRVAQAQNDADNNSKLEMKKLDLSARKDEADQRHLDRQATLAANSGNNAVAREMQIERLGKMKSESEAKNSVEGRMTKLGAEGKQRLDNSKMGFQAVNEMATALSAGDNTFSLWGDNDFTASRTRFEEALGRMQSGGAISKDEEIRFKNMAPTFQDNPDMRQKKLLNLQAEMANRMGTLGFKPEDFQMTAGVVNVPDRGDSRLKVFGNPEAEAQLSGATPAKRKSIDEMTPEELKKELGK